MISRYSYKRISFEECVKIASHFSRQLIDTIGREKLILANQENERRNDDSCATHDYCDANQCMIDAMEKCGYDATKEIEICNSVWDLAKALRFGQYTKLISCGLNADWCIETWFINDGRECNRHDGSDYYLIDNESDDQDLTLCRRIYNGEDGNSYVDGPTLTGDWEQCPRIIKSWFKAF